MATKRKCAIVSEPPRKTKAVSNVKDKKSLTSLKVPKGPKNAFMHFSIATRPGGESTVLTLQWQSAVRLCVNAISLLIAVPVCGVWWWVEVTRDQPSLSIGEQGKELGRIWKELSGPDRKSYEEMANTDKQRYVKEVGVTWCGCANDG